MFYCFIFVFIVNNDVYICILVNIIECLWLDIGNSINVYE